jgi:prevent-host-death family protein
VKRAKIGELKNNLSKYLDHVRSGGSVVILDRDRPIAEIVPLTDVRSNAAADDETSVTSSVWDCSGVARAGCRHGLASTSPTAFTVAC